MTVRLSPLLRWRKRADPHCGRKLGGTFGCLAGLRQEGMGWVSQVLALSFLLPAGR